MFEGRYIVVDSVRSKYHACQSSYHNKHITYGLNSGQERPCFILNMLSSLKTGTKNAF